MSGAFKRGRPLFPYVTLPEARKLAEGPSYSGSRFAGETLIALIGHAPLRRMVVIRNCYGHSNGPVMVENIREYLLGKRRWGGTHNVPLDQLGALEVYRGPFKVAEPVPNFMLELTVDRFERAWDALQYNPAEPPTNLYSIRPTSPTMALIDMHWRRHKVRENWTPERVRRLCALWKLTPHELAEFVQWTTAGMEAFLTSSGRELPGPVCVWFYFLENVRMGVNVFPDLQPVAKAS